MSAVDLVAAEINIMIVDDKVENLHLLSKMLTQHQYKVRLATSAALALKSIAVSSPDLILLDINMPDMNGYELCRQLKSQPTTQDIPVIFISAANQSFNKLEAFAVGGVDYITKPFDVNETIIRIDNQLKIQAAKFQVKQINQQLEIRVKERTAKLQAEIEQRKQAETKLMQMALQDSLTNLPNRTWLIKHLNIALEKAKQDKDYQFALLFFDCDNFKIVNDSLGHLVGDRLLKELARRLKNSLPATGFLSRIGGDEFTILLTPIANIQTAIDLATEIQAQFNQPFQLEAREIYLTASIGIVLGNSEYEQPEQVLRNADIAMYKAKELGKSRYQIFNQEMHSKAVERLQLEVDLRQAIKKQELLLYYQPIISLKTGYLSGFETLVRWQHSTNGMVFPDKFIPIAEETGLIIPMGNWILKQACRQMKTWQEKYLQQTPLTINVNVSVQQFSYSNLVEEIKAILAETGLSPASLKLEITESAIMENAESANKILQQLRDLDIKICIDDFGTGYSSLSYLHHFPIDNLKIDRLFVNQINTAQENSKIVEAIVNLSSSLDLTVTAEGIETETQFKYLKNLGIEFGQGYLFSRPIDQYGIEQNVNPTTEINHIFGKKW